MRIGGTRFVEPAASSRLTRLVRDVWEVVDAQDGVLDRPDAPRRTGTPLPAGAPLSVSEEVRRLSRRTVFVLGVGAVGGRLGMLLAPYGLTQVLVDHDVVEPRNVSGDRTVYATEDVGKHKVNALRDKISAACAEARVVSHVKNVLEASDSEVRMWARPCDAGLVAIDDGRAMLRLNALLYPLLTLFYLGVHQGGRGGQVLVTRPGMPCAACCLGVRSGDEIHTLHAEPSLGIHAGAVAHVAAQLLVQELLARDEGTPPPLHRDVSLLYLSHGASEVTPYGPAILQYRVQRDPHCPVCANNQQ